MRELMPTPVDETSASPCQDVAFAAASCRIQITQRLVEPPERPYRAVISVIDRAGRLRPLVFRDGRRAEISASSEALALSSALSFLQARFGALSEYPRRCTSEGEMGEPYVLDQ